MSWSKVTLSPWGGERLHLAGGEVDDPPPLVHRGVLPLDRADGHGPGVAGADGEVPAFRQALQLLVPHLAVLRAQQVQARFGVLGAGAGDDGVAVGGDVGLALRDRDRDRRSVARPLLERHVRGRGRRVEGDGVGAVTEVPGVLREAEVVHVVGEWLGQPVVEDGRGAGGVVDPAQAVVALLRGEEAGLAGVEDEGGAGHEAGAGADDDGFGGRGGRVGGGGRPRGGAEAGGHGERDGESCTAERTPTAHGPLVQRTIHV
ncbi:hypothetical protein GCM10019016_101630 [Streptomyces prasinosporus]|uniref:Uncharacterized protein n=1 Tax=Streptomyces prasinosporus TaxID=68256 RepID=A0ABP6U8M5_9ACTN|nr:hypothetical protein GCM10010332_16040 [Streptomyces albogriseolus]